MDSITNKFMIFATLILSLVIIFVLSNNQFMFKKNKRDDDIAIDSHPVVLKREEKSTLGKSENSSSDINYEIANESPQNSMSTSSDMLQNIYDIFNTSDVNAPPTTTFVPYALSTPAPSSSNSINIKDQKSTTGLYGPSSSNSSLTSYAKIDSNIAIIPSSLSINTTSSRYLGSITITGNVDAGQNIITVNDSNIKLTKGMGLEINGKIYIIKETSSYFNFFTLSYNTSVTLSEILESPISLDTLVNVYSILESDNNAVPNSSTTSFANTYFSTNKTGEGFESSNTNIESFIEGATNSTSTSITPTSTRPVSITDTGSTSTADYSIFSKPVGTSTSTTPSNPTSTTPSNPTSTGLTRSITPTSTRPSNPTSTGLTRSITPTSTRPVSITDTDSTSTELTISKTPNMNTKEPIKIVVKTLKMYILHLSKETTINSKLYFTPYEDVTDNDLERISSEIITTPETFSQKEGLAGSQNAPGLPDFNSCANNSIATKPPNSSIDNSSTSMLYITDCVAYYIYSATYKNKILIIQLDTNDNRKINAGYYRLSI